MSSHLKYADMKGDIESLVQPIINDFLSDKQYDKDSAQDNVRTLANEISTSLQNNFQKCKFITCVDLVSNEHSLFTCHTCIWEKDLDGVYHYQFKNASLTANISVYCLPC